MPTPVTLFISYFIKLFILGLLCLKSLTRTEKIFILGLPSLPTTYNLLSSGAEVFEEGFEEVPFLPE